MPRAESGNRRFSVKVTEEFRGATKETVSGYDLIIYNYDGKDMPVNDLLT